MANENFMKDVKDVMVVDPDAKYNVSVTENGALGYATTGSKFVDAMFDLPKLRTTLADHVKIIWKDLYAEDENLAVLFMFYVGDIRGGAGERFVFRNMFKAFCEADPRRAEYFIKYIPDYSRWDIMFDLFGIDKYVDAAIVNNVRVQFYQDIAIVTEKKNEPISLLAKWLPSYNTSSIETKKKAAIVAKECFGLDIVHNPSDQRTYRKMISTVRKALKLTETAMSSNNWSEIEYSAVPSKAHAKYTNAFMRHDEERYSEYIHKVESGEEKINASTLYPCDIVYKYLNSMGRWMSSDIEFNPILEEMWKALPSYDFGDQDILSVIDGSGSMRCKIGTSNMNALSVGFALGIYFAEHSHGAFRNTFMTFSHDPHIIKFGENDTLVDKLKILLAEDDCSNTNIERVFELVLDTAIKNGYTQEDLPGTISIVSDMEFDAAQSYANGSTDARLFNEIAKRYEEAGYKLPKLVFWNVNSRTSTIPVRENDLGVTLVSGYSVHTLKMVLNGKLDPFEAIKDVLMSDRYAPIQQQLGM